MIPKRCDRELLDITNIIGKDWNPQTSSLYSPFKSPFSEPLLITRNEYKAERHLSTEDMGFF